MRGWGHEQTRGGSVLVVYGAETPPKSRAEMEALAGPPKVQSVVTPRGKLSFYEEFASDLIPTLRACLTGLAGCALLVRKEASDVD